MVQPVFVTYTPTGENAVFPPESAPFPDPIQDPVEHGETADDGVHTTNVFRYDIEDSCKRDESSKNPIEPAIQINAMAEEDPIHVTVVDPATHPLMSVTHPTMTKVEFAMPSTAEADSAQRLRSTATDRVAILVGILFDTRTFAADRPLRTAYRQSIARSRASCTFDLHHRFLVDEEDGLQ
jgi:hypothetical protein